MLEKAVHEPDQLVLAILGHRNAAGIATLTVNGLETPNLLNVLRLDIKKSERRACDTYLLSGPAIPSILVDDKVLDPKTLTLPKFFTQLFHQETLSLRPIRQNLTPQKLLHLGITLLVANLRANFQIRPDLAVFALGATDQPRLALDVAEDVVRVRASSPVGDADLARALDTTGGYLVDVDVKDVGVF